MPKLLAFVPCEKVVISQDENNPTLIALLTEVGVSMEIDAGSKKPVLVPMRWSVFAQWYREPGDEAFEFQQRVRLVSPEGKAALDAVGKKFVLEKLAHRWNARINHIPTAANGIWALELYLRRRVLNTSDDWPQWSDPVATYPLRIHVTITESKSDAVTIASSEGADVLPLPPRPDDASQ
jgi:hypothetical protein